MSMKLHCPFVGVPLYSSLNGRNVGNLLYFDRGKQGKSPCRRSICAKQNRWIAPMIRLSHFCGQNVELLRRKFGGRYGMKVRCIEERFSRSKSFIKSLAPVWEEGVLLLRCSVFIAVLSGVCLLVWYGQKKAKGFIETKLLPSVCSSLGEYIQRDIDFGKVRRISPLSITLESCSIGPHGKEFSCGEVPNMKIRVHPFASLRRGKIVVDAVLSHPSVLVVQKKDFTWLGIPFSEFSPQKHLSTEHGIDNRTKRRRLAREEAAARWSTERDEEAKKAAEMGYIVSDKGSSPSKDEGSVNLTDLEAFLCMDDNMHWRDHHCLDTGFDYEMNHANLEKSFGVKIPGSGLKFWSKVIKGPKKHKFKRKVNGNDISESSTAVKGRILRHSALAALKYFQGLSHPKPGEHLYSPGGHDLRNIDTLSVKNEFGTIIDTSVTNTAQENVRDDNQSDKYSENLRNKFLEANQNVNSRLGCYNQTNDPYYVTTDRFSGDGKLKFNENLSAVANADSCNVKDKNIVDDAGNKLTKNSQGGHTWQDSTIMKLDTWLGEKDYVPIWPLNFKSELMEEVGAVQTEGIEKMLRVTLDSVHFKCGTLMLLAYGDREPREMENVNGHVKFQNHYGRVNVQLSGNCKTWRSDVVPGDGGWLSADVFVDIIEQKWHANLKIADLFAPLFERILEIPIMWSKGRATGEAILRLKNRLDDTTPVKSEETPMSLQDELHTLRHLCLEVHLCMSKGETFPNLHGQLDVTGLAFQILDAPSWFSDISASLCFRGQRIFLHNASGRFGDVPLEASGDFGIHPEEGEFHVMCQVPCVEVNALMNTFKMKPLMFPLAGSVNAVFNCQGPLDAPVFVGSGIMVSRKMSYSIFEIPSSSASEAIAKSKEAGAVAAFDRIPFSYLSANFTFNTDNCVADLYGIRASLTDGGEIRGAGNAWICPEGEEDEKAMDVNFSGSLCFDKIMHRYVPNYLELVPLKLGDIIGETKLSGSLLKPRFDIKWTAPKAEGSFSDARGEIIISHESFTVNSSSVAFDLNTKVQTSYCNERCLKGENYEAKSPLPFVVEGIELDLRMRGFEFFSLVSSYPFDSPKPMHLKATGRVKFHGKVLEHSIITKEQDFEFKKKGTSVRMADKGKAKSLIGEVSISSLKLNQLMLAPQLAGQLSISQDHIKLDATGRADESLAVEFVGPLKPKSEDSLQNEKSLSINLQKGQLKANICFHPFHSVNLEVRHLPLDELELASLRGTIQRAAVQLNLQKRRGHGLLSVLRPKFSGVLGEALDVAARWSGDVITIEKTVLEQSNSRYELQGEYVMPGTRERNPGRETGGLFKRAMSGHLGSVISSMGRWRMRLEVPRAEVAEMLPLARLISRSTDPTVHTRSKDFFIQSVQSVGLQTESLQDILEVVRAHYTTSNEVVLDDLSLPGLVELKGRWHGSLDARGGGNGDTVADFDFHGEDWEWGAYETQRVLAVGAYSNDDGLRLERIFIQKDNATIHADGILLGPKTNLHFAVLNFPVSLVPTMVQVIESSASDFVQSLRQFLAPIRGILHMEGDLRGSLVKPECDVQVRLLDGTIGGFDLGRAEVVASLTSTSRFLFNAKFEPIVQNGHVHVQGSVPVNLVQTSMLEEDLEKDKSQVTWEPGWMKEKRGSPENSNEKKLPRERIEEGWNTQLAESLKGLNWNILDVGEVRIDADIKDGGMMLLTALSPYANWLHGNADVMLQVRGTVEQPVIDGSASFYRASISSPVLWKPLTNFGGSVQVKSNRLCINSLESKVGRRGKIFVRGNLPLRSTEASLGDKIDLKYEVLEVRAKNILSAQVDSQMQIKGSILQPNISGNIKLSRGEAYLPHDKGGGSAPSNRLVPNQFRIQGGGVNKAVASSYVSRFFGSQSTASRTRYPQSSAESSEADKEVEQFNVKPSLDIELSDLKLVLGPELRIIYPLILNFAVSGELELNGPAHPKLIQPKGILTFENGDVNLVAAQVRLKQDHLNVAKFEPENGLDPLLDLILVGSEWQFKIQSRASNWQEKLVVTSTRSVEQDALSPSEASRVFESQLAESILETNGQLAFQKLATTTLEKLMPRIEGKGEFGQARWRLVYAPQIPSLLSVDPTVDPLKSLASNISFGTEVEVQLGKRLQASIVRQMKESEMAMQWTLMYQLTSRLRVLLQSAPSKRLLFEYSASSQD